MSSMEQLYQQVILDHARAPHGRGLVVAGPGAGESHQVNPTCGDEVTLRVEVADGRVATLSWEGEGCSISQASVSVLHDLVTGTPLDEVDALAAEFRELMGSRGAGLAAVTEDRLGDAAAFTGVAKYPARIKCALLGWAALQDALIRTGATASAGTKEDA